MQLLQTRFETGPGLASTALCIFSSSAAKQQPASSLLLSSSLVQDYAEPVLDLLDPDDSIFSHRLFRDSCRRLADGQYIKDLSILGRDLRSTIIVDNTPSVYSLHLDNAIPISSWFSDPTDKALLQLLPLLCHLANVGDVRSPLRRIYRLQDLVFPRPCMALKSTASH